LPLKPIGLSAVNYCAHYQQKLIAVAEATICHCREPAELPADWGFPQKAEGPDGTNGKSTALPFTTTRNGSKSHQIVPSKTEPAAFPDFPPKKNTAGESEIEDSPVKTARIMAKTIKIVPLPLRNSDSRLPTDESRRGGV